MATIYDPSYIVSYEEPNLTQLAYISTLSIAAYSESNSPTNLKIGSSSNLILQARQGIDFYFNSNNEISFYTSTSFGCNISKLLTIGTSNEQPYFLASNINFKLDGIANIGNTAILDSNNYQLLETNNPLGFLFNNDTSFSSNLIIDKDITTYQNIGCAGNIFSSTINLFNDSPNSSVNSNLNRVGYSFYVNKYNQLEILRTDQYTSNMQIIQKNSRIITFGNSEFPNNLKESPDSYNIMREFSGINGNYSNGVTLGMTDVRWNPIVGTSDVFYNAGNVGIGTNNPLSKLHVTGDITLEGNIIPKETLVYDLGSSNKRFRDLYLSGNTIYLDDSTITLDDSGNFQFMNAEGTPSAISGWSMNQSNVFIFESNVGIGLSNAEYPLHVNGAICAMGYCNLLINSESSTSTNLAPTASNLTVISTRLNAVSNVVYMNSSIGERALNLASVASNIAITAYSIASMASNAVVNVFFTADFSSNLCVNLSNYTYDSLPELFSAASNAKHAAILAGTTALTASISAISASNTAFSLSNNITQALAKAVSASNIAYGLNNNVIALLDASNASWTKTGGGQYTYSSNVGICTSNPLSKLHISHELFGTSNPILFDVGSSEIGWSAINFNGYGNQKIATNKNRWRVAVDQINNNDSFIIDTFNGSSNITLLNATTNGYIGIGISNPSYNLDIAGDINLTGKLFMNGVTQWNNAESNIYVIGSDVSIGKSNATCALDVVGTITACNIFALNIPMKILAGSVVMTSSASQLLSLGSESAGNFYNLYIGPTKNYSFFLTANIFYESTSDTLVTYITGSNIGLNLTVSSSNLLISSLSTVGSVYPWSLYKM